MGLRGQGGEQVLGQQTWCSPNDPSPKKSPSKCQQEQGCPRTAPTLAAQLRPGKHRVGAADKLPQPLTQTTPSDSFNFSPSGFYHL